MRNDFFVGTNWSRHLLGLHCRCLASKMLSWFWFWWQATDHCWYSQNGWQPWLQKSRERWWIVLGYWHQIMINNLIFLIGDFIFFFRNKDMLCIRKFLLHQWSSHCSCNFLWCLFRNILHPDYFRWRRLREAKENQPLWSADLVPQACWLLPCYLWWKR